MILLAVALGVFRLLLGQIPEYQDEIKAFVAAELGLTVEFATIDARLGFADQAVVLRHGLVGWQGAAAEAGDELLAEYLGGETASTL